MLERLYIFDGFAGWDPEVSAALLASTGYGEHHHQIVLGNGFWIAGHYELCQNSSRTQVPKGSVCRCTCACHSFELLPQSCSHQG